MIAAIGASLIVQEAVRNPEVIEQLRRQYAGDRDLGMFAILDESPDLPAEAVIKYLQRPDMPLEAAEAYKASYIGMAPWVKAECDRIAAELEALKIPRTSRYEKTGREERVGAKIVDQAEKERIARNRPAGDLAIGDVSEEA